MILFHNDLIKKFNSEMFETLLYKHNLNNATPKLIEFDETYNQNLSATYLNGFFLTKNNTKYILPQYDSENKETIEQFPLRVKISEEITTKDKSIAKWIKVFASFKILPKKIYNLYEISQFDGIQHEDVKTWTLLKIISYVAYCRRINISLSGLYDTGKTSYLESIGSLTNQGYVIKQPGSVLGLSYGLNANGFIALDEIGGLQAENRRIIANFLYQAGERSMKFKTGKGKSVSANILDHYDISNMSCILISNLIEDYKDKKQFLHYLFDNSQAINNRFLPLRLNDTDLPIERESRRKLNVYINARQFKDVPEYSEDITKQFISINKSLEWYRLNWDSLVDRGYVEEVCKGIKLSGRHYLSYFEILSGIYIFAKEMAEANGQNMGMFQVVFGECVELLNNWIKWYNQALEKCSDEIKDKIKDKEIFEEWVK